MDSFTELYCPDGEPLYVVRWSEGTDWCVRAECCRVECVRDGQAYVMSDYNPIPASNAQTADYAIRVHLMWDGCANWSIHDGEGYSLHTCGRKGVEELASLLTWLYVRADSLMTGADAMRSCSREEVAEAERSAVPIKGVV